MKNVVIESLDLKSKRVFWIKDDRLRSYDVDKVCLAYNESLEEWVLVNKQFFSGKVIITADVLRAIIKKMEEKG